MSFFLFCFRFFHAAERQVNFLHRKLIAHCAVAFLDELARGIVGWPKSKAYLNGCV